ncbi:MAG: LytR/AlgR family response regulator transcription factor [Gammaproteobacteria bacterium]
MFSAFVVDDESMARGNLIDALQQHNRWTNVQSFSSGKNLIKAVLAGNPAVVFLDIQMPGEDGLVIARALLKLRAPPLVVFVTAHSDYAVTAFELYAVDYLLKPFSDERLAQCISKLEHALDHRLSYENKRAAQDAWALTKPLDRLTIKTSTSIRVINIEQVRWIAANGNYVDIHHTDGKHLLRASLKQVLSTLPKPDFIQVHRGFAVRYDQISEVKTTDRERSIAVLSCGDSIPVGKSYRQELLRRLCG